MTKGRLETSKVRSVNDAARKPSRKKVSTSSRKQSAGSRASKKSNTQASVTRGSSTKSKKASKAAAKVAKAVRSAAKASATAQANTKAAKAVGKVSRGANKGAKTGASKMSKAASKKASKAARPIKTTTSKTTVTSKAAKTESASVVAPERTTPSPKATEPSKAANKQTKKLTPPRPRRPVQLGLGFDDSQDALAVLQQQNKRLMQKIAKRRSTLALFRQLSEELMQQASQRVVPYREELKALTREVLDLESRVLGSEKLVGRSRDRVRLVFHELLKDLPLDELEAQFDAESEAAEANASEPEARAHHGDVRDGEHETRPSDVNNERKERPASTQPPSSTGGGEEAKAATNEESSAPRTHTAAQSEAAQPEARSADKPTGDQSAALRALFKRLVIQWHPDRVRDDAQKAERTRLMKELTQAFEGGDLAKLVSLEQTLALKKESVPVNRETPEQRAEQLRRANAELERQLSELQANIEAVREDCPFTLDHRRKDPASAARDELDEFVLVNHLAVERATQTRDFVLNFARGKMTVAEFLQGPRRSI